MFEGRVSLRILDTDHVSLALRQHAQVVARLVQPFNQICTTIITVQEIFNGWVGVLNQSDAGRERLLNQYRELFLVTELLKSMTILEFDEAAFNQYETLLIQNPNLRKKRLQKDMRIAAIALSQNATVITRNRRDFEQVPGLKIEDWTG
jgi:tRNA(fMet)-specific endonuclease VapC